MLSHKGSESCFIFWRPSAALLFFGKTARIELKEDFAFSISPLTRCASALSKAVFKNLDMISLLHKDLIEYSLKQITAAFQRYFQRNKDFVLQICWRSYFPIPQKDLSYSLSLGYAKNGVAFEDGDADLDLRNLSVEIPRHERLPLKASHNVSWSQCGSYGDTRVIIAMRRGPDIGMRWRLRF